MRRMLMGLLIFLAPNLWAHTTGELERCAQLEAYASENVRNLNTLFDMNVTISWLTQSNLNSGTGRLSLMDTSAAYKDSAGNETIRIPRFCLVAEGPPSRELISLIVSHEYSHKIIDAHMDECAALNASLQDLEVRRVTLDLTRMHHTNIYLLGLKILKHFGIDYSKALSEANSWTNSSFVRSTLGSETTNVLRANFDYLSRVSETTSLNNGRDFLAGEYFDGFDKIEPALRRLYPKSSLVSDIRARTTPTERSCVLFKKEAILNDLRTWKDLLERATNAD